MKRIILIMLVMAVTLSSQAQFVFKSGKATAKMDSLISNGNAVVFRNKLTGSMAYFRTSGDSLFFGDTNGEKYMGDSGSGAISGNLLKAVGGSLEPYANQGEAPKGAFYWTKGISVDTGLNVTRLKIGTSGDTIIINSAGIYQYTSGVIVLSTTTKGIIEQDANFTAMGKNALLNRTSGIYNTAFGADALRNNTTASYNAAFGNWALRANTAAGNSAFGTNSLEKNTSGSYNCAFGYYALQANTTGLRNTAFGTSALTSNTTSEYNCAFGYEALEANTTGSGNVAIGYESNLNNVSGAYNVSIGFRSMRANQTGSNNVALGYSALYNNNTGIGNTAIGYNSLQANYANDNTAIGLQSMYANNTGISNTSIGRQSLYSNSSGENNIALGYYSGTYNTTLNNRLFINSLNRTNLLGDTTMSIIYGVQAATVANQKLYLNASVYLQTQFAASKDSSNLTVSATKWHRVDSINSPTVNVWKNVKFDTNVAAETTYGITATSDSTGFIMQTGGLFKMSGCGHWLWSGSSGTSAKMYIRVTVNGVEKRCLQANDTRTSATGDNGIVPYAGTIRVNPGDIVRVQYRVSNVGMDFEGDAVFDYPIAFSVNMFKISAN